jgi:hypothetical protein
MLFFFFFPSFLSSVYSLHTHSKRNLLSTPPLLAMRRCLLTPEMYCYCFLLLPTLRRTQCPRALRTFLPSLSFMVSDKMKRQRGSSCAEGLSSDPRSGLSHGSSTRLPLPSLLPRSAPPPPTSSNQTLRPSSNVFYHYNGLLFCCTAKYQRRKRRQRFTKKETKKKTTTQQQRTRVLKTLKWCRFFSKRVIHGKTEQAVNGGCHAGHRLFQVG